jgi:hypothetical protein
VGGCTTAYSDAPDLDAAANAISSVTAVQGQEADRSGQREHFLDTRLLEQRAQPHQ